MGIIDEKGRLFRRINVIDFLVILLLLGVLPVFYFGYKIIKKERVETRGEFVKVEIKCRFIKLEPEVLKLISVGDQELDESRQIIGEVIRLGEITPYQYERDTGTGQGIVLDENLPLKQVEAKLKLKADVKVDSLYYKDMPIKVGMPLEFRTSKYIADLILKDKAELIEKKIVETFVTLKDLDKDTFKQISVADKEVDEAGKTIAEILSLGKIENSTFKIDLGGGNFITGEDSQKKQISTKMKLTCQIREDEDNRFYFKGERLTYDTPIEFTTDKYKVGGVLAKTFKKVTEKEVEKEGVDLYVTLKDLDKDTFKQISVADKEVDEAGKTIAEILSLGKIENSTFKIDLGGGNFITGEDSQKKQISTKMKLACQIEDDNWFYFKGERLTYDTPIEFTTDKYKVRGVLAKTFKEISPLKEKWISIRVKFSGVNPEIANIVQQGDIEKDAFDTTAGSISSIVSNRPAQVLALRKDEFITLNHPFNKDIVAFLNVRCTEKEGVYYFKNYPLKMGNNVTFSTELYSLSGLIVGLEVK